MKKSVKQPLITQTEINKMDNFNRDIKKNGYRPWVKVRGSHTHGQGHIIHSFKTNRNHHLLSRGERLPFFMFEQDSTVIDILEQYPLPIFETMKIAEELNVVHPGAYKQRKKYNNKIPAKVMTTDFVIVKRLLSGKVVLSPYSFKYSGALDITKHDIRKYQRTKQKLKIEELYWASLGLQIVFLTECDFDKTVIYNLEFFRECFDYPEYLDVGEQFKNIVLGRLQKRFLSEPKDTLRQHIDAVADDLNTSNFQVLYLFQEAVYHNDLKLDLSERIELYRPLALLNKGTSHVA